MHAGFLGRLSAVSVKGSVCKKTWNPVYVFLTAIRLKCRKIGSAPVKKKRIGEIHKEDPEKPIIDVIGGVRERQPTTKKLTIEVEATTYSGIGTYKNSKKIQTEELAASELVDEGLKANDIE